MAKKTVKKKRNGGDEDASTGTPKFPYTATPSALRKLLEEIPKRPRPARISLTTLKTWGVTKQNDTSSLRVAKAVGLLTNSAEPTADYNAFMTPGSGPGALGRLLKTTYAKLFESYSEPNKATPEELRSFFNIHGGGSPDTIRRQVETFKALSAYATFGPNDPLAKQDTASKDSQGQGSGGSGGTGNIPVRIDLHIHLPENKTKADYDAIMESIATHLYGRKP